MRPPVSPPSSDPLRPPMPILNGRPPMPAPSYPISQIEPKLQQPNSAPMMRYPPGPGYMQNQQSAVHHQPSTMHNQQKPGYPQMTMPPTQQMHPPYPRNSPPSQGYTGSTLAAPQQPPAPKVNPAAIPSVVSVLEADEMRFKEAGQPFYTFSSIIDNPPPLPTTHSVSIIDDGNSSPQFIRSTLNHVPITEEICDNTKIPLSLVIQPFASNPQSEVPLVDFGASGPLRCNRCRAYINPNVQFTKGGRIYVCNLCDMSTEVPDEY